MGPRVRVVLPMSKQRLRHVVGALICGLVPLIPLLPTGVAQASAPAPTQAAPAALTVPAAAGSASIRDLAPPVMQRAAQFEAGAPARSYPQGSVQGIGTPRTVSNPRLFREVFGFAFASSLGDPTIGYPSWNFGLLDRKSTRLNSSHGYISYA